MSGLGELLFGDVGNSGSNSNTKSINNNNNKKENDKSDGKFDETTVSPRDSFDDRSQSSNRNQGIFPNRVEKGDRKEDDRQSNASSVDDYVAELLDPNDRPRNVWHVVEGPKKSSSEETPLERGRHRTKADSEYNEESRSVDIKNEPNMDISPELQNSTPSRDKQGSSNEGTRKQGTHSGDRDNDELVRDKSRERSSSSRQQFSSKPREHRRDSRDKERGRDNPPRDSERDRHRSSSSRNRSQRRRDESDDDDDDHDRRRRGRGGSRHARKRSASRSRSRSPVSSSRRHDRSRSNSPQRNSRTVIIMQLSQRIISRDLEDYFGDNVGNVREVKLIKDSRTQRHKGVAYIEFDDSKSASKALSLNGRKLNGAPLMIQPVNSRSSDYHSSISQHQIISSRSNHHTLSSTHPSSRSLPPNAYRVYIGALHTGITEEMLRTIVEPFGPVLRVEVIKDRTTGTSRGYAFVTYANTEDGQEAVRNLDGFELAGKNMRVSKSTEKSEH